MGSSYKQPLSLTLSLSLSHTQSQTFHTQPTFSRAPRHIQPWTHSGWWHACCLCAKTHTSSCNTHTSTHSHALILSLSVSLTHIHSVSLSPARHASGRAPAAVLTCPPLFPGLASAAFSQAQASFSCCLPVSLWAWSLSPDSMPVCMWAWGLPTEHWLRWKAGAWGWPLPAVSPPPPDTVAPFWFLLVVEKCAVAGQALGNAWLGSSPSSRRSGEPLYCRYVSGVVQRHNPCWMWTRCPDSVVTGCKMPLLLTPHSCWQPLLPSESALCPCCSKNFLKTKEAPRYYAAYPHKKAPLCCF